VFTVQQLFGDSGSTADDLPQAPFLERARLERQRDQDVAARLALGGYVVVRLVDRLLQPDPSPEAREGFRWHLEAVRKHLRELPDDAAETAHLLGIADCVSVDSTPLPTLRLGLQAYAYFLEHEGRWEEALDVLALAMRTHGGEITAAEFAGGALVAARLNRLLARWERAGASYSVAEQAALEVGDDVSVLRGRLGCAAVLRGQGNLPASRAAVIEVLQDADALGLAEVRTIAYGDLGALYSLQGMKVEALQAKYQAFLVAPDPVDRLRALGDVGVGLVDLECREAARIAFEIVAGSEPGFLVRTNALIELMDLDSIAGNRVAFERRKAEIETLRSRMPPSMVIDYHYKWALGLARFGQVGRARELLATALRLAETSSLNAWYFKIEDALGHLAAPQPAQLEPAGEAQVAKAPAVLEVELGLQQLAAVASG